MMKKLFASFFILCSAGGYFCLLNADEGVSILDDMKFEGQIRPRYEYADVTNNSKKAAQALTARTKLEVSSNRFFGIKNLKADVGVISVNNFGWSDYNSLYNGHTDYDVIVDPQYAMISNASLEYKYNKTVFHAGRGQVNLDNQRFIGTVGWRQLERSYDTVFVSDNSIKNLNLLTAWVYGAQGVKAGATKDTNSVLLHASYEVMKPLKVTVYGYMYANYEDTYGISFTGKADTVLKLSYRAEYAVQKDNSLKYGSNAPSNKVDANYFNLDISADISGFTVGANYEFLSGDDATTSKRENFVPWLGTNHKFNGWADMFYVASVPSGGLKDVNFKAGYKNKRFGKILGVYHIFDADTDMKDANGNNTKDLGSEFDILYKNKIAWFKNLSGLIKGAFYKKGKAKNYNHDKQVFWVMLDYKFSSK